MFSDENVREMQYIIIGNTELPDPTNSIRNKCNADETHPIEVPINFKNLALEKAMTLAIDRTQAQKSRDGTHGKSQKPDSFFFKVEISNQNYF